jgi:membrane-bound ClpP family serine protease
METHGNQDGGRSAAAQELLERVSKKRPPAPPRREPTWRDALHALLTNPSVDRWFLLIRIGISVLIVISLFVVGGQVGFVIALALFVVGVVVSMRIRRV